MGDEAATPVLYFREDVAWHQAGGGAAQDDVFAHKMLYVLEDVLLDLKLLKYTLLENTCRHMHTGKVYTQKEMYAHTHTKGQVFVPWYASNYKLLSH